MNYNNLKQQEKNMVIINRRVNYVIIRRANGTNEIMLVTRQPRAFTRQNIILQQHRRHIFVPVNTQESDQETDYDPENYDFDTEPYSETDSVTSVNGDADEEDNTSDQE